MPYIELDKKITEYCKTNKIFGMLRITVKDKTEYEKSFGFADAEKHTEFKSNSMFTLYSMSKPFCAIGLLKLKDKGLISLDAHPSEYVPEAAGFNKNVTIRNLLYHTSGLPDFEQNAEFCRKYAPGYAHKTREHLKLLTEYPQYFEPGTDTKYANINYVLCALIIENVSGTDYAAYMKKEVFEPLGAKTAIVHDGKLVEVKKSHDWLLGAGDIVGTVDDVYCLNKAIKNRLLLSKETWNEVLTPPPINRNGMGCSVTNRHGKTRITHNGGHIGFRTLHFQLPDDDFDVIFLSNSGYGSAREDIGEIIYSAIYDTPQNEKNDAIEMDKGYIK